MAVKLAILRRSALTGGMEHLHAQRRWCPPIRNSRVASLSRGKRQKMPKKREENQRRANKAKLEENEAKKHVYFKTKTKGIVTA
jgi:hypothetical protein